MILFSQRTKKQDHQLMVAGGRVWEMEEGENMWTSERQ